MAESHRGATFAVISVQGFPFFPGRGSGYMHVGISLWDVTAAFFLSFPSFFFLIRDSPQLAQWHYY